MVHQNLTFVGVWVWITLLLLDPAFFDVDEAAACFGEGFAGEGKNNRLLEIPTKSLHLLLRRTPLKFLVGALLLQ